MAKQIEMLQKILDSVDELKQQNKTLLELYESARVENSGLKQEIALLRNEVGELKKSTLDAQQEFQNWKEEQNNDDDSDVDEIDEADRIAEQVESRVSSLLIERAKEDQARSSRQFNIKVTGISEEEEDVDKAIESFFKETMFLHEPGISTCTRVGKKQEGRARPIIIRFKNIEYRDRAMRNRGVLKGKNIWLNDDLTPQQQSELRVLLEKVKELKAKGKHAYVQGGRVWIKDKSGKATPC